MRTISDTIMRLGAQRARPRGEQAGASGDLLADLTGFGANPGALRARTYIPADLPDKAPLVVVLHGCTQSAADYAHGSGWPQLAERHGFALLFPEQRRANNPNLCFNWFVPEDSRRDSGEALSIRQMIARLVADRGLDAGRVFVTGLSAGGAMASIMLAAYPDVFAGGAIIAGLPYGVAGSVPEAFDRMRGHGGPGERELAELVRAASPHRGPWPTVSVWHGSGDRTVAPGNAQAIVAQWRGVHGLTDAPHRTETVDGQSRRVWSDAAGREVIEEFTVAGMGHGTPLDPDAVDGHGASGAYMLDVGISSTRHIAQFWSLTDPAPAAARKTAAVPILAKPSATTAPARVKRPARKRALPLPQVSGVQKIIEDALRAAGLLK